MPITSQELCQSLSIDAYQNARKQHGPTPRQIWISVKKHANQGKEWAVRLTMAYDGVLPSEKHEITGADGGPIILKWPENGNSSTQYA